jgi:WhiB family redox-sensing transcriptional regulator
MTNRLDRYTYPITALDDRGGVVWTGRPATDFSWLDHAGCKPANAARFFPPRTSSNRPARNTCNACPVRYACLEYGIHTGATEGVWGGLTASGRTFRNLRKIRHTVSQQKETP